MWAGPGLGEGEGEPAKDTGFFRVGHSSCGAADDVAVEGNLEGVAIRSVVQQPTEEATASSCLHSIPVKGRAGLWETKKGEENQGWTPAG